MTLPVRPDVKLGAYTDYPFAITIDEINDESVDKVIEQLRDQQASLVPVEERGAATDDYAVIKFIGRREGQPVDGAQSDRTPLIIGRERFIPGFEDHLIGLREGDEKTFSLTFPDDYPEAELAGKDVEFEVGLLELREKRPPEADDDFARSLGVTTTLPRCAPRSAAPGAQRARSGAACLLGSDHRVRCGQRDARAARPAHRARAGSDDRRVAVRLAEQGIG